MNTSHQQSIIITQSHCSAGTADKSISLHAARGSNTVWSRQNAHT